MSGQTSDQASSSTSPETPDVESSPGGSGLPAAFTPKQVENVLTLDLIMNSARRVRRVARVCLRADLEADYLDAANELGDLVDSEGNLIAEGSLADGARAAELRDRIKTLREQMAAETYAVEFEAMNDDDYEAFNAVHRDSKGAVKDPVKWRNELIAACAVNPRLSVGDVEKMRAQLSAPQMQELANEALSACASGGVDVPKLPNFYHSPSPQE